MLSRRDFFVSCGGAGCALAAGGVAGSTLLVSKRARAGVAPRAYPARFWKKLDLKRIECGLCPKHCKVEDRERGFCGVRENRNGEYMTLVWGQPCAVHLDPIEKKPFFHFLPGSTAFSIATAGCNLECKCCQNWDISQSKPEDVDYHFMPPAEVVQSAKEYGACVTFTYSEPIVFLEYCIDTAMAARKAGVRATMVTGGSGEAEPMKEALKYLDAVKVDLKGFTEDYYQRMCKGKLEPVKKTLEVIRKSGVWLELVHLCIPGQNDSESEIRSMCQWVKGTLGADVPIHFTRFHPEYQMKNVPPTPNATLIRCREIGLAEGLHFVYTGNVPGLAGEDTACPQCHKIVVSRRGFELVGMKLKNGHCGFCGAAVPGVWS
jgi:pyruvate formate lyase activating enzyme